MHEKYFVQIAYLDFAWKKRHNDYLFLGSQTFITTFLPSTVYRRPLLSEGHHLIACLRIARSLRGVSTPEHMLVPYPFNLPDIKFEIYG
jgi:hypothetical protein